MEPKLQLPWSQYHTSARAMQLNNNQVLRPNEENPCLKLSVFLVQVELGYDQFA